MYRCSECNKEYKEKVDFCDCGNDEFIYIEEVKPVKSAAKKEPMTIEQKSHIVSLIFFALCILLSIVVWLIPISKNQEEIKITEDKKENIEIPNIDKFWDNTLPKSEKPTTQDIKPQPVPEPQAVKVQPPVQIKTQPKQQPKVQTVQNVQKTNVTKPTINSKPVQTQQNKTNNNNNAKQTNINKLNNNVVQPKTQETKPKVEEIKEQPKNVYNPNSPEMLKYKGELRAALFRKFPVGGIQGSGSCSVHFSIDSNGKLINRGFTKQSDNKSLNDAVYYMLMSVPTFKAPPAAYSGETINMTFTLNNGNYAITIN